MAFHYSPNIITDGLVLYLDAANTKSYISGSTTWNDISRGGNNGTLVNGPTFNSANNGSIVFDGTNDYVSTNIVSLKSLVSRPCSLSVWFKTNISSSIRQVLIADWNSSGSFETTRLEISGFNITSGKIGGSLVNIYGGSDGTIQSTTTIQTNVWYNVVIQCPTISTTELYLNGILENSVSSTEGIIGVGILTIGRAGSFPALYLSGNISNTSIYNRALSSSEILQNYNTTKSRFGL